MNCTCIDEVSEKLKEQGLALSDKCRKFRINDNKLEEMIGLPLQAADGKKFRRGQPSIVFISFCPFCGKSVKSEPVAP